MTLLSRDTANIGFGASRRVRWATRPGRSCGRGGAGANTVPRFKPMLKPSLPLIIEEVKRQLTADKRRVIEERKAETGESESESPRRGDHAGRAGQRNGWDSSPVRDGPYLGRTLAIDQERRLCLASPMVFPAAIMSALGSQQALQLSRGQGRAAWVYGAPASVGACAGGKGPQSHRDQYPVRWRFSNNAPVCSGRPSITTSDADIMHNNRAWHQELMFASTCAAFAAAEPIEAISARASGSFIDYAEDGRGFTYASEGPISDPTKWLRRSTRAGFGETREPYMIDVITQPR